MNHAAIRDIFCPEQETIQAGFAIVLAPRSMLAAAVTGCLRLHSDRVLYVSGNYPPVLTGLDRDERTFHVRRALTAYQLLSILDDAWAEEMIIIEHDRGLFDDAPDTAVRIGLACNDRARAGTVILIASRPDEHIRRMMPWAAAILGIQHRETNERETPAPVHVQESYVSGEQRRANATVDL